MLGWFRKRESPRLIDQELGELRLDHGYWWGEIAFAAAGTTIQVSVRDVGGAPVAGSVAAVHEFGRRYRDLCPAFATQLRQLLEPWHRQFGNGKEPLEEGDRILTRFELESIEVDPPAIKVVEFCLKQGWDDAVFRVSLVDWIPTGLGVDD